MRGSRREEATGEGRRGAALWGHPRRVGRPPESNRKKLCTAVMLTYNVTGTFYIFWDKFSPKTGAVVNDGDEEHEDEGDEYDPPLTK